MNPNVEFRHLPVSSAPPRADRRPHAESAAHLRADAGIRDFLYSAQITNRFFGEVLRRRPGASKLYTDSGKACAPPPALATASTALSTPISARPASDVTPICATATPQCARDRRGGGPGQSRRSPPPSEILNRIRTVFGFASARFENGDRRALVGDIFEQGGPTQSIGDYVKVRRMTAPRSGERSPTWWCCPPTITRTPEARYPVLYFLHGQGQKARDLAASALLFLSPEIGIPKIPRSRRRASRIGRRCWWSSPTASASRGSATPEACASWERTATALAMARPSSS